MLIERADLLVREGTEQEFAATMTSKGLPLLAAVPGVRSTQFGRGVEHPQKFMLLVEWETMDAHTAFTKSPAMGEFRTMLKPFTVSGAMEHFNMS